MAEALLWALVGGTVLGLLGKALTPGDRDRVPLWLTITVGVGGVLLGGWLHSQVAGGPAATGNAWRLAVQAVLATSLVAVAALFSARPR